MNLPRALLRMLFGKRLPVTSGRLVVDGTGDPITIRRDAFGVPYIEAAGDEDAWFGLGFCQGQDRAFQLEVLLRLGRGTLAEILGASALPADRLSRRIGFYRAAESQWRALDAEARTPLEDFAAGVRRGVRAEGQALAHEFSLLRCEPSPFRGEDVLAGLKFISFALSTWPAKLSRFLVLELDGPEALRALDQPYAEGMPVTRPVGAACGPLADRLERELANLAAHAGITGSSNNWVLAGARTASGRPLLANDPHLAPMVPGPFYLAHVRTPSWAAAGAVYVGTPAIACGHNGHVAWGLTAGFADNTDLYLEEVGPDAASVRQNGRFVACEVRREVFSVRGQPDVAEMVLVTERGPIVSPALEGAGAAISMRATWLESGPVGGLLTAHRARSFGELRRMFAAWPLVSLNLVAADEGGAIGWQLIGDVPRRERGAAILPLPAWERDTGWEVDRVPFEQLPFLKDPPQGYLATANNMPKPDGEAPYLGHDWADGYRQARILEMLSERRDWDIEGALSAQLDVQVLPWREMRAFVVELPARDPQTARALELLRAWDGRATAESSAASVYEVFLSEMAERVVRSRAPRSAQWALGRGFNPLVPHSHLGMQRVSQLAGLFREQPEGWFERSWTDEAARALQAAVRRLEAAAGSAPGAWAWGAFRSLTLNHLLGGRRPFNQVFNLGPIPLGGDSQTVAHAGRALSDPAANPTVVACLRAAIDVGDWGENSFALPGGQCGNPLSPHYADQLPLWRAGRGVRIAWSPDDVRTNARATLTLVPRGGAPDGAGPELS